MSLSQDKIALVAKIFAAAPYDAVRRLESVLGAAHMADPTLTPVYSLAVEEAGIRRAVEAVFAPLVPLTQSRPAPKRAMISVSQLREAWTRLAAGDPGIAECAAFTASTLMQGEEPPHEFDLACLRAAGFAQNETMARLLRLAPILRAIQPRLAGWVKSPTGDNIAAIRLAARDAVEANEEVGPLFWAGVMALLDEPWQVLRLISAATDRPSDRFLAASELAPIGERILADIDDRIAALRQFDAAGGTKAGVAAATSMLAAAQEITEFEQWLALSREGPWGQRIAACKAGLASAMEGRLRETEPAVGAALPTQARGAAKNVRPIPKLVGDPEPLLVTRAEAFLTLLDESRAAAATGGFAAARGRVMDALDKRLDQYCEDLLDLLNRKEADPPERARAYLQIGASFFERIKGANAAQIIRRRAASVG